VQTQRDSDPRGTEMRQRFARATLAVCLAATFLVLDQAPAHACSCASVDPAAALADSDGAFVGVTDAVADESHPGDPVVWAFTATDWIKGRLDPGRVAVDAPRDSDSCGFSDQTTGEIGVLVRVHRGRLTSGLCDVTTADTMRSLTGDNAAMGEVAALDGFPLASPPVEIVAAAPEVAAATPAERSWLRWLSGFVAVGVVLAISAITVALIRRRL
jgi:hypothetical protein